MRDVNSRKLTTLDFNVIEIALENQISNLSELYAQSAFTETHEALEKEIEYTRGLMNQIHNMKVNMRNKND